MWVKNLLTLIAALVAIALVTFGAVFFLSRPEPELSVSNLDGKPGYFFAETAANYIYWALQSENDRELDGFNPRYPAHSNRFGDLTELRDPYRFSSPQKQLKYFSNRVIDYSDSDADFFLPGRKHSVDLKTFVPPVHLVLHIEPDTGTVSLAQPAVVDSQAAPPKYGAIVWLVGSFIADSSFAGRDSDKNKSPDHFLQDVEGNELLWDPDGSGPLPAAAVPDGSDMYIHSGVDAYGLTAYIIAYYDARPVRMLRVVLGRVAKP